MSRAELSGPPVCRSTAQLCYMCLDLRTVGDRVQVGGTIASRLEAIAFRNKEKILKCLLCRSALFSGGWQPVWLHPLMLLHHMWPVAMVQVTEV